MNMKVQLNQLSKSYLATLQTHLKQGPRANLEPAVQLGRRAVALGLETLGLARTHELALTAPEIAASKNGHIKRVEKFFYAANGEIENTHRAARQSTVHLGRLKETLEQRTDELAATNRQLKRGVVRRKVLQEALEKKDNHYKSCLEESPELQNRLRQLTHRVLVTQENELKHTSHELQDEIAQTLLGINVRLLSLKQVARSNTKGFKNEIISTQLLVAKSAQSVRRVARKIRNA